MNFDPPWSAWEALPPGSGGCMTTCRYCVHSEMRCVFTPRKGTAGHLHCLHHNTTVRPDDTCEVWEREPGADDDLGGAK